MAFTRLAARLFGITQSPSMPPVVIGATGGSGTRAMHGILSQTGLFMGAHLNGAGDAMDFEIFLNRFINPIIETRQSLDYRLEDLPAGLRKRALAALRRSGAVYLSDYLSGPWGWKNPRAMYILPLIHELYPGFAFIHLVRDGRDMAFSRNQNQPRKHFEALFGEPRNPDNLQLNAVRLWDRANRTAGDWGERTLGSRYILVRYEDLCRAPLETVKVVFDRLDLPVERLSEAVKHVERPESLGRWRERPSKETVVLTDMAAAGLTRFGYMDGTDTQSVGRF